MKRKLALALALIMILALAACGNKPAAGNEDKTPTQTQAPTQDTTQEKTPDLGDPTNVTITFWHARSSGKNYDQLTKAIETFNSTNEYGITVEEAFQGSNSETAQATMTAIAGKKAPTMVTLTVAYVTEFATNEVLADMSAYADRDADTFKMDNYLDALLEFSYYDNKLITFPYCRSTAVMYYNKDMFDDAGYAEAPKTMEELETACKAIMDKNPGVDGFCFNNDDWYVGNFLVQLGSNEVDADDKGMSCLTDGTMEKVLTSWRKWVDDGWCIPPTVTDATTNMREAFYQGKLACFFESSGGMANILKLSRESNINVGVAFLPHLAEGKAAAPAGGTNIGILDSATDNEKAAAWEFIKFLATDEQSKDNSVSSGYLPITKSTANSDGMKEYWASNPEYQVAFDQLNECGHDFPFSTHLSEVGSAIKKAVGTLIQDQSCTPAEALDSIKRATSVIDW